ncbi:MAG: hypothetical protein AAF705_18570, partial [Bacteroidota bacterium]
EQSDEFNIFLGLRSFMNRTERDNWQTAVSDFNRGDLLMGAGLARISFTRGFLSLHLDPRIGYFLNERLVLGMFIGTSLTFAVEEPFGREGRTFRIEPFARYYFGNEQQRWRWFGEAGIAATSSWFNLNDIQERTSSFVEGRGRFGANWFLTPNLAFELAVLGIYNFGINDVSMFPDGREDLEVKILDNGFILRTAISVQYFLNR